MTFCKTQRQNKDQWLLGADVKGEVAYKWVKRNFLRWTLSYVYGGGYTAVFIGPNS